MVEGKAAGTAVDKAAGMDIAAENGTVEARLAGSGFGTKGSSQG